MNPGGREIEHFVSHAWIENFGEFVQSTYRYALAINGGSGLSPEEVRERAMDTAFYICAFANNQWNLKAELGGSVEQSPFYKVLMAKSTKRVMMNVDQDVATLDRAWCAFEFYLTHKLGKAFFINTKEGPIQLLDKPSRAAEAWVPPSRISLLLRKSIWGTGMSDRRNLACALRLGPS